MKELSEYSTHLKALKNKKLYIRKKVLLSQRPFPLTLKLQILSTSSMLRMQTLSEELLEITKQGHFLSGLGTLRMMLEELTAVTYVLHKLSGESTQEETSRLLDMATVGRRTGERVTVLPIKVGKMSKGAEKYIKNNFPRLAGKFKEIYDYLSEFVHPNGPSRHHFWKLDADVIYFWRPPMDEQGRKLILKYGIATIVLYMLIHKRLKKVHI